MLWVNLVIYNLASMRLATDKPDYEDNGYPKRTEAKVSPNMLKKILLQSIYQLSILFALVFYSKFI